MNMFDETVQTTVKPDGSVEVELVEDSAQELESAMIELHRSWREFCEIDGKGGRLANHKWWRAAECLMLANNRVADLFLGRDRSPASIKAYADFRCRLIIGEKSKANA